MILKVVETTESKVKIVTNVTGTPVSQLHGKTRTCLFTRMNESTTTALSTFRGSDKAWYDSVPLYGCKIRGHSPGLDVAEAILMTM